jgi:hypothetical protein
MQHEKKPRERVRRIGADELRAVRFLGFSWDKLARLCIAALLPTACLLPEVSEVTASDSLAPINSNPNTPPPSDALSPSNSDSAVEPVDAGRGMVAHDQPRNAEQSGSGGSEGHSDSFICDGNHLLQCGADSSMCQPIEVCTSVSLCDASMGRCRQALCAPGSGTCEGNVLRKCNVGGTEYEREDCESRHCNALEARCDTCEPFSSLCDGQRSRRICRVDGAAYELKACAGATPYCYDGRCVVCAKDNDCPAATCRTPFCSGGACFLEGEPDGTPCVSSTGQSGTCLNGVVCR